jgi:transposase-like protein
MEKRFLEECLAKGMSLEAIGREVKRHPQTVKYWLGKYGLRPVGADTHASRGGIRRDEIEPLIEEGLTIDRIARRIGVSDTTIRYWLRKYGLRTDPALKRRAAETARQTEKRRIEQECPRHGLWIHVWTGDRFRCTRCRTEAVARRRRKVKSILVEEAGGQCAICGYDRCDAALQFHHRDPAQKEFSLGVRGVTRGIDKLREEAKKCVLLCATCHAEVEVGVAQLPLE